MNKIKLDAKHHERLAEIEAWMLENIGPGSRRFKSNTWMGTDDWYYYEDYPEVEPEVDEEGNTVLPKIDDSDHEELDLIFVFRRESDIMMFSLKWI